MPNLQRLPLYRVVGLPRSEPESVTLQRLTLVIDEALSSNERAAISPIIALVPSCYEERQVIALVEFRGGTPDFLASLEPLKELYMEMGDDDIAFDRHFFGFTQLYAPQGGSSINADVIAISGLDGHAYGSWRGKGSGRMWLRDFLSVDLPCCRTMTFGYNSKLSSRGFGTILDYGREFLEELRKVRFTPELQRRPIIFIAHSFGGIVLAHSIVEASKKSESTPELAAILRATYAIFFFATPHKGMIVEDIASMISHQSDHPRQDLLRQIDQKSESLKQQLSDFRNIVSGRKIISFYETEQTRSLEYDLQSGSWKRSGSYLTAVDIGSALLDLPDHLEEKIPLDADHSSCVKFDSRAQKGYTSVKGRLQMFGKTAPSEVAARFRKGDPSYRVTDMGARTEYGNYMLHTAIKDGDAEMVQDLLDKGADVNMRYHAHDSAVPDAQGSTPLQTAARANQVGTMSILLDYGAKIEIENHSFYGMQAIHIAAMYGKEKAVKLLCSRGAHVEASCGLGVAPILLAAMNGHTNVVQFLVDQGVSMESSSTCGTRKTLHDQLDIDERITEGSTALLLGARNGHVHVVQFLVERGANLETPANPVGNTGFTPLLAAAMYGHADVVKYLLSAGAEIEPVTGGGSFTPLIYASGGDHAEVVQLLIDHGAPLETRKTLGVTALGETVYCNNSAAARVLLNNGANIEARTSSTWFDGATPLILAIELGSFDVLEVLIEKGAKATATNTKGENALNVAERKGNQQVIDKIRQALADHNDGDEEWIDFKV